MIAFFMSAFIFQFIIKVSAVSTLDNCIWIELIFTFFIYSVEVVCLLTLKREDNCLLGTYL